MLVRSWHSMQQTVPLRFFLQAESLLCHELTSLEWARLLTFLPVQELFFHAMGGQRG